MTNAAVAGPTPFSPNTVTAPAYDHYAITPSDTTNFQIMFRGIYVGVSGDIVVLSSAGNLATYKAVPQGTILPVIGVRVNNTNTTATNLIALV